MAYKVNNYLCPNFRMRWDKELRERANVEILYMPLPDYCLYNKMNTRDSIIKRVQDNEPTKLIPC